jgi:hypothetical protein
VSYILKFGKFKGQPIENADTDWLTWLSSQSDLRPDTATAVRAELGRRGAGNAPAAPAKPVAAPTPSAQATSFRCPHCRAELAVALRVAGAQ